MQIWLVRHALAVDRELFDGADEDRPLTPKGERRFRRLCRWLVESVDPPDRIVSSPLVRAVGTAAILAEICGIREREVELSPLVAPGCDCEKLIRLCDEEPVERIAVVGHEPDFSQLFADLIGGGSVRFAKGAIAAIEFAERPAAREGKLCWFIGPKLTK